MAEFNRYNRTGVVLADPALRTQAISGVFRGDDVEGFVQALSEVYGIPEHHAADGSHVLVTQLCEGQRATVLQLPVVQTGGERAPKAVEAPPAASIVTG